MAMHAGMGFSKIIILVGAGFDFTVILIAHIHILDQYLSDLLHFKP